jgi:hypothetical protein
MHNEELLQKLGLGEKEAKVYLVLLSLGSASVASISNKSGLKRPNTYLVLDELRKKGLVRKLPRAKKQLFIANSPDELLISAEQWLSVARQRLPELARLAADTTPDVSVLYFEGERGLRDLLRYGRERMRGKTYIGFYAEPTKYSKDLLALIDDGLATDIKKFGISYRGIVPEHPYLRDNYVDNSPAYEFKTAPPSSYTSSTSIDVGDGFLRMVDVPNLQSVIIENPAFAHTLRQAFEMLWNFLPPVASVSSQHLHNGE